MKKYLTMVELPSTEQLGSQMWHFAALCHVASRTGHRIVFFEEYAHNGRGLRLHHHFKDLPFELISVNSLPESDSTVLIYPLNMKIAVESPVFQLSPEHNYNFRGLFINYRYWWPIREQVRRMYRFAPEVVERARATVEAVRKPGREIVSLHVRRTDYLNGMHVNLTRDYYLAAIQAIGQRPVTYLVFSDDMAWCRETFQGLPDMVFAEGAEGIVDMCAMSLCDHHIIANSSFSFWGAFLNPKPGKLAIAPARNLKADALFPHINYCWLPEEFQMIDVGNV